MRRNIYISPVHLYIHVPFCARRCTYCDFAIAVRKHVPTEDFVQAILREWQQWQSHQVWDDSPVLDTIYFGGGTPSHLDPSGIERMVSRFAADRSLIYNVYTVGMSVKPIPNVVLKFDYRNKDARVGELGDEINLGLGVVF